METVIFKIFKGTELLERYFLKDGIIAGIELDGRFQIITRNGNMLVSADVFYKILKIGGAKEIASFSHMIFIPEGTNTFSFTFNLEDVRDFDKTLSHDITCCITEEETDIECKVFN